MSDPIYTHEVVATRFAIDPRALARYERLGLIQSVEDAGVTGFRPSEIQRIWSIVTYQRDLGVNLAGVEVLLKMRDQRDHLQSLLAQLSSEIAGLLADDGEPETHA